MAGGSVFREAVSKTIPASASDQRNTLPEVIKIPESKATAFQTFDSAVYSFNRTVGEIILDAVKNSCHVLLQGGDGCVHVLPRTTVVFQNINDPLPVFFLQCIEYILIRIVDLFKLWVIFDNQVKGIRKQCLDVLGIQVDNYGFHRSSFPVRVAVHEVLPDCLRQSVFKNSHDVMTSFSVAADE